MRSGMDAPLRPLSVRQFTLAGIEAFRRFLAACRLDPSLPAPWELLEEDSLTERVIPHLEVQQRSFGTRREAAEYLTSLLAPLPQDGVAKNAGLWTWLSFFFLNEICPLRSGTRLVKNDYYYVFEPDNARHCYRHLLFIAWHAHRIAKPFDRLFMCQPLSVLDKITEEVMKRLYLTRIPCIFEVLEQLYWDEVNQRPRRGIADARNIRRGDLYHRFPIRIRQLEKTYDLVSLNAEQLLELLGEEFQSDSRTLPTP